MKKLVVAIVLGAVIAIAWWLVRSQTLPTPSTVPTVPSPPSQPTVQVRAIEASTPAPIRHLAVDERRRIAWQIEAARQHTPPPTLGSDDPMATPEQVLAQLQALHADMLTYVDACTKLAPGSRDFKTEISLVGDLDIGTLVDAKEPVVATDGTALPQAFSDCIRGELQTLELPPMKTGDAYKVTFEIDLGKRD